ncbi:hypothetical protein BHE74_00004009 [Ensete ventricosum]|nr:hypothetical protein BHE74_00004009 [Ensete ventricosum]
MAHRTPTSLRWNEEQSTTLLAVAAYTNRPCPTYHRRLAPEDRHRERRYEPPTQDEIPKMLDQSHAGTVIRDDVDELIYVWKRPKP